jgi:hypothetical protein
MRLGHPYIAYATPTSRESQVARERRHRLTWGSEKDRDGAREAGRIRAVRDFRNAG